MIAPATLTHAPGEPIADAAVCVRARIPRIPPPVYVKNPEAVDTSCAAVVASCADTVMDGAAGERAPIASASEETATYLVKFMTTSCFRPAVETPPTSGAIPRPRCAPLRTARTTTSHGEPA